MYGIGKMGRGAEHLARTRTKMPSKLAESFGVFTEANLFSTAELAEMQGGIWEFIKDPSEATWSDYHKVFAKNFLGIMMARSAGFGVGGAVSRERAAIRKGRAEQGDLAEKVLQAKEQADVSRETKEPEAPTLSEAESAELLGEAAPKGKSTFEVPEGAVTGKGAVERPATEAPKTERAKDEPLVSEAEAEALGQPKKGLEDRLEEAAARGDEAEFDRVMDEVNKADPTKISSERTMRAAKKLDDAIAAGKKPDIDAMSSEAPLPKAKAKKSPRDWVKKLPENLRKEVELMNLDPEDLVKLAQTRRAAKGGDVQAVLDLRELEQGIASKQIASELSRAEQIEQEIASVRKAEADQPGAIGSQRAEQELRETPETPGTEPIRKVDIFNKMQGYRGDPIQTIQRKGRISQAIRGKTASLEGFFERNRDLIRFRGGDTELATRAHEFSHGVQRHAEGFERELSSPAARAEAAEMLEGYGGLKRAEVHVGMTADTVFAEAFAEYHARTILGEPGLPGKYPALTKEFAAVMAANPRVHRQFREVVAMGARYRAQGGSEPSPAAPLLLG